MTTSEIGREGERAATDYLRDHGYQIRHLNWREGRYELDIVAEKEFIIHFVEVKTRRAGGLTTPEEALTPRKAAALRRAAQAYLSCYAITDECQFDLAAVDIFPDGSLQVRFTENALELNW